MKIDFSDIVRLCAEIHEFSHKADLCWKGVPVITWEFATVGDFANTRAAILQALEPHMVGAVGSWQRTVAPDTMEIDCHGVTFRLVCKQRHWTPRGPYGIGDMKFE